MPKLRLNDLLRPTTKPEQANFLDWFYTYFDSGAAAHRRILNVEPIYYIGTNAGTEFLVYNVSKLYIALEIDFSSFPMSVSPDVISIFNELNNLSFSAKNTTMFWDVHTGNYNSTGNIMHFNNLYFSCLFFNSWLELKFNGYRVTLN